MAGRRRHQEPEPELIVKSGPPLTEAHKDLIRILARESVEDFLREIEQGEEIHE